MEQLEQLVGALLPWYEKNRRDLPWRKDREPYHVWLSEIMLQQTRVEAVKGYYLRFLEALPTMEALAECGDDRLNKLWEGLGYYSRARNLKKAAKRIVAEYGGFFPREYRQIRDLPGIGDYTAGAICSICFDMPTPAVDGNVLRLVTRLTDDHTPIDSPRYKETVRLALEKVYPARAGDFTQALMELGATLCGPNREPDCESCPCKAFCLGRKAGSARQLPVKLPKAKRREEDRTVLILRCGDRYALEKRPEKGLLAGLWQFPNVSGYLSPEEAAALAAMWGTAPRDVTRQMEKKHIFTHIQWNMRGICLEVDTPSDRFRWMTPEQINGESALPTAFRQFWEETEDV